MSAPLQANTPPQRPPSRAAVSTARHAPWLKPPSTTRSRGCPVASTAAVTARTADDSHGSLASTGARKLFGYQDPPAARGAT